MSPRPPDDRVFGLRAADLWTLTVFVVALGALFLLRGRVLETPYFWDEIGYYIPNAVSMYRNHLNPIPTLTIPQSYPPLQPFSLVVGWWIFGFSIAGARIVVFVFTAAAIAATFRLGRELFSAPVGVAAAAFTLATPVLLGQAGFAQPETMLALFTAAATLTLVRGRMVAHAVAIALLLMTKWTAIVALPAFGLYALWTARTWREGFARQIAYVPGLALLAAWLAYFYAKVGALTSTDPHYARANLWDNLAPKALVFRGAIRLEQLVENDAAWLVLAPALLAGAFWCWRRATARGGPRPEVSAPVLLLVGQCALYLGFLTVSGYLLPRYFVPVTPLFAVLGAAGLYRLFSRPVATAAAAAIALVMLLGWFGRVTSGPALLDGRPDYMDFIATHVEAARYLEANFPDARIASTWPVLDELHEPYFGYVDRPLNTVAISALPDGPEALERFDVLFEPPIPQNPNPAHELAERLGLVEIARFESGRQVAVLWKRPPAVIHFPVPRADRERDESQKKADPD